MLFRTITVLAALLFGAMVHIDDVVSTNEAPAAVDPPGIYGANAEQRAIIHAAQQRFEDAGLTLPPLRIYVHEDPAGCNGALGRYSVGGDQHRVDLCTAEAALHEFAHAWEYHNLDDAARTRFMEEQGLSAWNDRSMGHAARGVERAAFAIVWGLNGEPINHMQLNHYAADIALYEQITGLESPRLEGLDEHLHPVARPTVDLDSRMAAAVGPTQG